METKLYIIIAFVAAGVVAALASGMFSMTVSRAFESIFDTVEYALASGRKRRADYASEDDAAAQPRVSTASLLSQQNRFAA